MSAALASRWISRDGAAVPRASQKAVMDRMQRGTIVERASTTFRFLNTAG